MKILVLVHMVVKYLISQNQNVINIYLKSDYEIQSPENQLIELKKFYQIGSP